MDVKVTRVSPSMHPLVIQKSQSSVSTERRPSELLSQFTSPPKPVSNVVVVGVPKVKLVKEKHGKSEMESAEVTFFDGSPPKIIKPVMTDDLRVKITNKREPPVIQYDRVDQSGK